MSTSQDAPLRTEYVIGDPRGLTLLDVNARYMTKAQFKRLVDNVRRDGCLTSAPLVWLDPQAGTKVVLSGNHRVSAAIEAGLNEIGWLEVDQPLPRQRRIALQLSHNAVEGQDDPAILKELFEELESVEWREFAGLDDATLKLLDKVDVPSIGESQLAYEQVTMLFLPHEREQIAAAFEQAAALPSAETYAVALKDLDRLIESMNTARVASDVKSNSVAFTMILDVFAEHVTSMAHHWEERAQARPDSPVPTETLFGYEVPAHVGTTALAAIRRLVGRGEAATPVEALELMAARVLDEGR